MGIYDEVAPLFVDDPTSRYVNEEAVARLRDTNDSRFDSPSGVLKVDAARWAQAQEYERKTWCEVTLGATDARNYEFAWGFRSYNALPVHMGRVIELGAGPFTNLRLILEDHTADSITLLDPLIDYYIMAGICSYQQGSMAGVPIKAISSAIEAWQPEPFDTVIMVNVLHHCYDADTALERVWDAVAPGGWLVFYEPPREIDPMLVYDVGHPLSPDSEYMNRFMARFKAEYRNGWFFIGRKL